MTDIKRFYGNDWNEKYLYFFGIALATFLITTNVMSLKFFEVGGMKFGAGMIFFPFSLILGDIVTEVYGFQKTRRIIFAALGGYVFFALASQIVIALPPAAEWTLQQPFETIFKQIPRVFLAGCLGYLAGELCNAYIMSRMKISTNGKHFWLRAIVSTIVGEAANTSVFQLTAFLGVMPTAFLLKVILNGTMLKTILEIIILPVTSLICQMLKRAEGVDYFDEKPTTNI